MKTKATVLTGPKEIRLVERDLNIGPKDVLVKTKLAGICGTDKNFYLGLFPKMNGPGYGKDDPIMDFPYYIGHEGGGVVVDVGNQVSRYQAGDRVMSFNVNGTMAEYFFSDEADLEPALPGLPDDLYCLGEPIACAMFSGLHSRVNPGDTAVVFGAGFAGQIIAQVMKLKGAHQVVCVDVVDDKLAVAGQLGADVTINLLNEDPVAAILDLTNGEGADVVAEAAGVEQTINQALTSVKHNGTLVFYSWVTQDVKINISRLHHDSLYLVNTGLVHHTPQERSVWTPWALRPVLQKTIEIDPLVNRRFRLDQVKEAFEADITDQAAIKVVLDL